MYESISGLGTNQPKLGTSQLKFGYEMTGYLQGHLARVQTVIIKDSKISGVKQDTLLREDTK